jgi:N-methylhydantoinase A
LRGALVPRFPGVTSALGCVIADIRHDRVQTVNLMLDGLDAKELGRRMVAQAAELRSVVEAAGLSIDGIDILFDLDMHYVGQTHTVSVPLPVAIRNGTSTITPEIVREAFERSYLSAFSRLLPGLPVRIVSLKTAAIGRRPQFDLSALASTCGDSVEAARRGTRPIWFAGRWHDATIWSRLDLPVGAVIEGPAVLEQPDATTIVDPDLTASVDAFGNLLIERANR